MCDGDKVEPVLSLLAEGATPGRAAREAGVSGTTVSNWATGRVPHERPSGRIRVRTRTVEAPALDAGERAAHDAATEESVLPKAVLDDLEAAGSAPASTSRRRCAGLGEGSRAEAGPPLTRVLASPGISKSPYGRRRARLGEDGHAALRPLVAGALEGCGRRGHRAARAQLRRGGVRVSEKVVRRSMRERGPAARRRCRRRWGSCSGEASPAPADLPLREGGTHGFRAAAPNGPWATDIAELGLPCGARCRLSPVTDRLDGRPVAWSVGRRPTARLADSSLEAPGEARPLVAGAPAVHSDRGGHCRWPRRIANCEANGLARSMSRKGMSCDSARAGGFFGLLGQEFPYSTDWEGVGVAGFMAELDARMRWLRSGRMSEALGWLTPDERRLALGYAV